MSTVLLPNQEEYYSSTRSGAILALTFVPLLVGLVTSIPSSFSSFGGAFSSCSASRKNGCSESTDDATSNSRSDDRLRLEDATVAGLSTSSRADLLPSREKLPEFALRLNGTVSSTDATSNSRCDGLCLISTTEDATDATVAGLSTSSSRAEDDRLLLSREKPDPEFALLLNIAAIFSGTVERDTLRANENTEATLSSTSRSSSIASTVTFSFVGVAELPSTFSIRPLSAVAPSASMADVPFLLSGFPSELIFPDLDGIAMLSFVVSISRKAGGG
mmetsp:Transcript_25464/g.46053  ORF Transcript_25464/g.46053 Transcript_25464/m.46053 type:complete len:275 (-) Transcript_25464:499-1323(-)